MFSACIRFPNGCRVNSWKFKEKEEDAVCREKKSVSVGLNTFYIVLLNHFNGDNKLNNIKKF